MVRSPPPNADTNSKTQADERADASIAATAADAVISKVNAVSCGYYPDPFVAHLASGAEGLTGSSDSSSAPAFSSLPPPYPSPATPYLADVPLSAIHPALRGRVGSQARPWGMTMATPPSQPRRGQPLIRRGTHARVSVVDRALSSFLAMQGRGSGVVQVVVLGAGRDTSYLRFLSGLLIGMGDGSGAGAEARRESVRWYEVDHPTVIAKKADLLLSCPQINVVATREGPRSAQPAFAFDVRLEGEPDLSSCGRVLPYHLIGHDLRLRPSTLFSILRSDLHGFDPSCATLFVMECVQMYMPVKSARALLGGIATECGHNALLVLYDPILCDDGFGRVMERHLTKAGVVAPSRWGGQRDSDTDEGLAEDELCLTASRTLESHLDLFASAGFDIAVGCDMMSAYESVVPARERSRANAVEMLDEVEEFVLIMRHYCFIIAGLSSSGASERLAERFCAVGIQSPLGFEKSRCTVRGQDI